MRKVSILLLAGIFFVPSALLAQAGSKAEVKAETQKTVSTDELKQKLDEATQKMQRMIREADLKSAERSVASQKVLEEALKDETAKADELRAEIAARDAAQSEEQKKTDENRRQEAKINRMYIAFVGFIILVCLVICLVIGFGKMDKKAEQKIFVAAMKYNVTLQKTKEKASLPQDPGVPEDPAIAELREISRKSGFEQFPTIVILGDGRKLVCHAWVKPDGGECLGSIDGDLDYKGSPVWVRWENRRKRALKFLSALEEAKNTNTRQVS